jgi:hypothetical protein
MKTCAVKGCNGKIHGRGYCHKHWQQLYRYGHIFDRTRYDRPRIRIEGDVAHVTLYDKRERPFEEAIIDADDIERVAEHKWHLSHGYVQSSPGPGSLHRFVMNAKRDQIIDHINRNPLDNRKANLRVATRSINVHNSKIPVTNQSGVKGVYYHKATGGWEAFIGKDGKRIRKLFMSKEDAIQFRKELECSLI